MNRIIGIAGGIGSGKSVVSHVLRAMGYQVYDTDREARLLMDRSSEIKRFLTDNIHPCAVGPDGAINRALVAAEVFAEEDKRLLLNAAVHAAVRQHIVSWHHEHAAAPAVFVECAIICESGIAPLMDEIWEVVAPLDLRIRRVCRRNGMSEEQVIARIESQKKEAAALSKLRPLVLPNDGCHPLLPALERALAGAIGAAKPL